MSTFQGLILALQNYWAELVEALRQDKGRIDAID